MLSSSVFYPLQFALDNRSLFPSAVVKILKPFIAKPTMCRNNNIKSITHFAANVKCGNHSAAPHRVLRGTPGFRQNDPLSASIPLMTRCASITVGYPLQRLSLFCQNRLPQLHTNTKEFSLRKKVRAYWLGPFGCGYGRKGGRQEPPPASLRMKIALI